MKPEELRAVQAPIKARYRGEPEAAHVTLAVEGNLGEGITCTVATRLGPRTAGLHPSAGGDGESLCSGDMLLEALVACAGVTLNAVAAAMGVRISRGVIRAEGDVDFRGTLGVAREVPVGFERIRMTFEVETDASGETLAKLLQLTERYCLVYQSLAHPPEITAGIRAL